MAGEREEKKSKNSVIKKGEKSTFEMASKHHVELRPVRAPLKPMRLSQKPEKRGNYSPTDDGGGVI